MTIEETLKRLSPEERDKLKKELVLKPLNSKEELRAWLYLFFDIYFPQGVVYPTSTHGPVDAMWEIYHMLKTGENAYCPEVAMLASRDSGKTLSASALEVLCMIHFRIPVAHMAAIKSQSAKAIQYVSSFFRKLEPYLQHQGWKKTSDSKTYIEWITDLKETVYLNVITATIAGANCIHPNTSIHKWDGSVVLAKDVKPGDCLKTWDYSIQKMVPVTVGYVSETEKQSLELIFSDDSNVVLSEDHQIFTNRGWITAAKIRLNNRVTNFESKVIKTEYQIANPDPKQADLKQLILGTLLGDSSLYPTKNRIRYQTSHTTKQKLYLEFIRDVFLSNNIDCKLCPDKNKLSDQLIKLFTKTHDYLEEFRHLCVPKKRVTKEWLDALTYEGIAYWFMDDASGNPTIVGSHKDCCFSLATCGFSLEENELIVKWFVDKGFECTIKQISNSTQKKYNAIYFTLEASRKLSEKISPYFISSLRYKLLPSESLNFTRCIETGKVMYPSSGNGFRHILPKNSMIRGKRNKINKFLTKGVKKINHIGKQKMIDIHIETDNEHHKSFIANSLILLHNSEHTPLLAIDELDVIQDPRALEESSMIPTMYKGYFPLTVNLSTRKFKGGLMEKTLKKIQNNGGKILRWNLIDITERITPEEAQIDKPKVKRYLSRSLPMENLTPEEFEKLAEESKPNYELVELYAGIVNHPLAPVMRNYLVDRPQEDYGNLYKPVIMTLNNFKKVESDTAEAQLLCNKPSSSGLVYPRFDEQQNVISIKDLLKMLMGEDCEIDNFEYLKDYVKNLGLEIIGGGDWGYTDYTALGVFLLLPGGVVVLLDTLCEQHLELADIVRYGAEFQSEWNVSRWYVDQNYPAYLKTLRKPPKEDGTGGAGWKIPTFKKVVEDGITGLQGKIVDATNKRMFFVLDTPNNKQVINAFGEYRWALDGKGEVIEGRPYHDKDGVADLMDMIRYPAQNRFMKNKKVNMTMTGENANKKPKADTLQERQEIAKTINQKLMQEKVGELAANSPVKKIKRKGRIFWA